MTPRQATTRAATMATGTRKRTLTRENLVGTVAGAVASAALVRPKASAALREKVVLAVTAVND